MGQPAAATPCGRDGATAGAPLVTLPIVVGMGMAALGGSNGATLNRFHISALAFQRAQQLKMGARPRVEAGTHKLVTVAVLEVLADTISWSTI